MPSPELIKANVVLSVPDGNNFLVLAHHGLLSCSTRGGCSSSLVDLPSH
jgi:hypothetical protein